MIKSIIGSILFLCLCFFIFSGIHWLSLGFLSWFYQLEHVKQLVVFMMLGSFIWLLFGGLKEVLINLSAKLSIPNGFAKATILIASVITATHLIDNSWNMAGTNTGREILSRIFSIILILEIVILPLKDFPQLFNRAFVEWK